MWHQLGEALGISEESLDRYASHPPEESIIKMLDQWLRGGSRKRTWRDVADALKKIGLEQLARDIEKVYETGNLTYL
jgi:pyrroloquinoline quinone (PQQ) biosynthesis protein C